MCDDRLWSHITPFLEPTWDLIPVPLYQAHSRQEMQSMIAHYVGMGSHILGFSMGGYLALEYLISAPKTVHSLILVGASATGLDEQERSNRRGILSWLAGHEYQGMTRKRLAQFVHPSKLTDPTVGELVQAMDRDLGRSTLITQLQETSERPDLRGALAEVECPTLIVGGALDRVVPSSELIATRDAITGSQLELMDDTGHMLPLEQPQLLVASIQQFYARINANK